MSSAQPWTLKPTHKGWLVGVKNGLECALLPRLEVNQYFSLLLDTFSTHSRTGSAPIHRNACQLYLFFSRYFREISSKAYFIVSMPTNFHTLLIFELDSLFDVLIRQYKARCKYSRRHYLFTYTKIVFPAAPTLSLLNFLFGQRHQRSAQ